MVRRPSGVVHNVRSSPKFYVDPPWVGGAKVCSRHLGHKTKMAATPLYGTKLTLQKSSTLEPADRFPQNLVCSIWDSSPS